MRNAFNAAVAKLQLNDLPPLKRKEFADCAYGCYVHMLDGSKRDQLLLCTVAPSKRKARRALWHFNDPNMRARLIEVVPVNLSYTLP